MIEQIQWHYFGKGQHLVTFRNGNELVMSSGHIATHFNLGQLTRRRIPVAKPTMFKGGAK